MQGRLLRRFCMAIDCYKCSGLVAVGYTAIIIPGKSWQACWLSGRVVKFRDLSEAPQTRGQMFRFDQFSQVL